MKSAILTESKKPLVIADIELPKELEFGQVQVKLFYSGICGAQINEIDALKGPDKFLPHLLGHEGSGVVASIGEGVDDFEIGDHVVFVFVPSCGNCIPCKEGRPALCEPGLAAGGAGTLLSGEKRFRLNGHISNIHMRKK